MTPPVVRVRVSGTSANLGPGFDCLGLALDLVDEIEVRVSERPGVVVRVEGEGAGEVGHGEKHLVVRALRAAVAAAGFPQPAGLELLCRNAIPHGRGLGSSAAAVVAGLAAGRALVGLAGPAVNGRVDGARLDDDWLLGLATELEGHCDNAAAALHGGLTIAWLGPDGPSAAALVPHPDVTPLVLVPTSRLATHHARSMLPDSVPHADAAVNIARAALLVHALTQQPDLLLPATEDHLHQRQRAVAMPETIGLVCRLRGAGVAAVVSGAGPSVLVLTTTSRRDVDRAELARQAPPGWELLEPAVAAVGVRADVTDNG